MKYDIYDIQNELSEKLKKKRYIHSLGVMYTAQALAMRYDVSLEKAAFAGILHDCAKEMKDDELLRYCKKHNINVSSEEEHSPFLLHGKAGAYIAQTKYKVNDNDILDAIRFHTTGKPAMTTLGKIIYIADFIEPNRKPLEILPMIRKEAFCSLDKTCALILYYTIDYLGKNPDKHIDSNSKYAYDYYKDYM